MGQTISDVACAEGDVNARDIIVAGTVQKLQQIYYLEAPLVENDVDIFQNKLLDYYQNHYPPETCQMECGFYNSGNRFTNLQEIFTNVTGRPPQRIFIEGEFAFGKSTTALKLLLDWQRREIYMRRFKLAIFLPKDLLQNNSIPQAIEVIGVRCGFQEQHNTMDTINANQQDTLIIVDALDQCLQISRDMGRDMDVLNKIVYSDMTVIVLSRPHSFLADMNFHERHITILGIDKYETKRDYLQTTFGSENHIDEALLETAKWFHSPLFLADFVKPPNLGSSLTQTEMYATLLNCLIKFIDKKYNFNLDDFDLLSLTNSFVCETVQEFGKLALQNINNNNCQENAMHDNKMLEYLEVETENYNEIYSSILQYIIAYSVWMDYKRSNAISLQLLKYITEHYFENYGNSRMLPFLFGLFCKNLNVLLSNLAAFSHCFASRFHCLYELFQECPSVIINEEMSSVLKNFIPTHMDLRFKEWKLSHATELLKFACSQTQCLLTDDKIDLELLFHQQPKKLPLPKKVVITFERMSISITVLLEDVDEDRFHTMMALITSPKRNMKALQKFFQLSSILSLGMQLCYAKTSSSSGIENVSEIRDVTFPFALDVEVASEDEANGLLQVIQTNNLSFLKLMRKFKQNWNRKQIFLDSVAAASGLKSFHFSNTNCISVDLHNLSNGGTKRYKFLALENCSHTIRGHRTHRGLGELECNYFSTNTELDSECISKIKVLHFECCANDIADFIAKNPVCPRFKLLECLIVDRFKNMNETLSKSLQTLILNNIHIKNLHSDDIKDIVNYLINNESKVVKLIIDYHWLNQQGEKKLFKQLNEAVENSQLRQLKTIDVIFNENVEAEVTDILQLMEGLRNHYYQMVNIVMPHNSSFCNIVNLLSLLDFNVKYRLYGTDDADPEYYKIQNEYLLYSGLDAFCITAK